MSGRRVFLLGVALVAVSTVTACRPPLPEPVKLIPPARIVRVDYGQPVPGDYVAGPGVHLWITFGAGPVDVFRGECDGMGGELELDREVGFYCLDPVDF